MSKFRVFLFIKEWIRIECFDVFIFVVDVSEQFYIKCIFIFKVILVYMQKCL